MRPNISASRWPGYAVAIDASGAAFLVSLALHSAIGASYPFAILFVGVLLGAWFGGLGRGSAPRSA